MCDGNKVNKGKKRGEQDKAGQGRVMFSPLLAGHLSE